MNGTTLQKTNLHCEYNYETPLQHYRAFTMPLAYTGLMQTVVERRPTSKPRHLCSPRRSELILLRPLLPDPEAGDLMPGTGGYQKRRFGRAGMGKRGGARIVDLYGNEEFPIFLITAYAKAEKGNLSKAEQNTLTKMAKSFFVDYGRKT